MKLSKFNILAAVLFMSFSSAAHAAGPGGCAIAGSKDAVLTIEEFVDFECPYCARGANTMKQVLKEYKGKVRLVLRNMPLPMHTQALNAARAFSAVCLQSPALAEAFQQEIFAKQDRLKKEGNSFLVETAEKIGVDVTKMQADMDGAAVEQALKDDRREAELHGFTGTPSFMVGSEPVTGAYPYTEFKKIIDRQLGE